MVNMTPHLLIEFQHGMNHFLTDLSFTFKLLETIFSREYLYKKVAEHFFCSYPAVLIYIGI